jgi:Domain of unknown function (DUF2357)
MARVLPYPWSLFAPRDDTGASFSLEDCETTPPLNPESLTFFTRAEDEALPHFAGHRHAATPLADRVLVNPHTGAGRRLGLLATPSFPHEKSDVWRVRFGNEEYAIPVHGSLRRASAWEDPTDSNAPEVALRDTVDFLCGYFTEAISLTRDKEYPEFHEFAGQALARLSWAAIWNRWKKVSTGEEPRMARVVEIAFAHLTAIRNVCERPRRMLIRQRELLPVGRVQELDSVCLRDLIRRPGRTVLEKAGGRQEILAITRRETVDTAENRVIREFIRLCQHRARAYERENGRAREHPRMRTVIDLRSNCERLEVFSPLSAVGRLVGAPRPNYVLQKDRRYHPLWVQYDKLRREEEAVDNIWPWCRKLWAEFVRGIVVSFLLSDEAQGSCIWQQDGQIDCYLRAEHHAGSIVPALSISSRWLRKDGKARMLLVHPAHAHLCPGLEELLPRLGTELALVVYSATGPMKPKSLLCIYSVLSLGTNARQKDEMAFSLQRSLDQVAREAPGLNVHGLLMRGEWVGSKRPENPRYGCLDYLAAPAGGPFWFREFPELLNILLEELAV